MFWLCVLAAKHTSRSKSPRSPQNVAHLQKFPIILSNSFISGLFCSCRLRSEKPSVAPGEAPIGLFDDQLFVQMTRPRLLGAPLSNPPPGARRSTSEQSCRAKYAGVRRVLCCAHLPPAPPELQRHAGAEWTVARTKPPVPNGSPLERTRRNMEEIEQNATYTKVKQRALTIGRGMQNNIL